MNRRRLLQIAASAIPLLPSMWSWLLGQIWAAAPARSMSRVRPADPEWPTTSRFRRCRGRLSRSCRRTSGEWGGRFLGASSLGNDFNFDFNVSFTEEQQREGDIEYNYERGGHAMDATQVPEPVATERGHDRDRRGNVHAREAGHERVRARGRRCLPQLFHLCARTGRPRGDVSVARSRSPEGAQREWRASGGAATTSTTASDACGTVTASSRPIRARSSSCRGIVRTVTLIGGTEHPRSCFLWLAQGVARNGRDRRSKLGTWPLLTLLCVGLKIPRLRSWPL